MSRARRIRLAQSLIGALALVLLPAIPVNAGVLHARPSMPVHARPSIHFDTSSVDVSGVDRR